MGRRGFGPGKVTNRRVNRHLQRLIPANTDRDTDYTFSGKRVLDYEEIPGGATSGICELEAYIGENGQFEVHETRTFDPDEPGEWTCQNRIYRTESEGVDRLDPFEYAVKTAITIGGKQRTDTSRLTWDQLGEDPIYGGREAQAATLLAEKIANKAAVEMGGSKRHQGSLSGIGSLTRVVDDGRRLDATWADVNDLLGPEAETIAAHAAIDEIDTDEQRRRAESKGVDFLREDVEEEIRKVDREFEGWQPDPTEPWETLPDGMTPEEARERIREMHEEIREMKDDL